MRIFATGALLLALTAAGAHAAPADDMKRLLEQGKAADAYQLGRQHPDLLGDAQFDFYFGVAAINGGRVSEGVLALERLLLVQPENVQARLELARGYYLLGETARAREEFQALQAQGQPAQVTRVIEEYLEAIAARETRFQTTVAWHVEFGGGHDNNVPYGVNDPNITLPIFGDITLSDSAVKQSDRFAIAGAGIRVSTPLRTGLQLFGSFTAEQRANRKVDIYDQDAISGSIGLNWQVSDKALARLTAAMATQTIDHQKYRDSESLSGEAGYQLGKSTYGILGVQTAKFRYAAFNAVRDADYDAITLGVRQRLPGLWRPDIDFSLSAAREEAGLADRQDLSRDLRGLRIGVSVAPLPAWTFSIGATRLDSDYKAADPLLQVVREDRYTGYDLGVTWQPGWARNWSVRGEYSQAHNRSNLPLYEYSRRASMIKLRYDFK